MKSIVVKKRNSHRATLRLFTVVFLLIPILLVFCFKQSIWAMLLLCLPIIVGMLLILLYYETWEIFIDSKGVRKKLFGIPGKTYSYHQIKDVISRWSNTEQEIIRITFTDNKTIMFRSKDENADKARKQILSYHSIRNLP